ncbi:DUF3140 domain-containing protein [Kribbella albertanoniae]|uniref:DUF3140 domain-containing protein n=1 Tax=Kribbella albertanoniae TaxID=1266829 RepID=UPI003B836675
MALAGKRNRACWCRSSRSTSATGKTAEASPDERGDEVGVRAVGILGKRRADLTEDDVGVMEQVVRRIRRERGEELEPCAGDAQWRHALMSVGHKRLS